MIQNKDLKQRLKIKFDYAPVQEVKLETKLSY